ncbi:hypothetical protein [Singulisphaera sp. PoT]|uniref:hypothetical protein n=1 Tax=Singulisphaera sp. PoT TaxID=3411797 RepID=UPI003BF561EE
MKYSIRSRLSRFILLVSPTLALAFGCADDAGKVPLYTVTGSVQVDGKPASGVQIRFYPADKVGDLDSLNPTSVSKEDGSFLMGTYTKDDGAPEGFYKVTLYLPAEPPNGSNSPDDLLGGEYLDPAKTPLKATVKVGENRLEPFQVAKSGKTPRKRPAQAKPDLDGSE